MAEWPASLYGCILADSFSETPPENVIRTQMDVGPAKIRRRSTANVRPISIQLFLTAAQVATFETFFVSTIQGGAIKFDMYHPRTHVTGEYRFTSQPVYTKMNEGYKVSANLELLP